MLHSLAKRVYHSHLYSLLEDIGVSDSFADVYWRIQFAFSEDVVTRTVNDISASFYTKTRSEFTRFRDPTLNGEIKVLEEILESLNTDDVFYDIGANVGLHACFASKIINSGSVVAIEPHSKSAQRLNENIGLNNESVIIREVGFSSENTSAKLVIPTDQAGSVGDVRPESGNHREKHPEIQLVRGDDKIIDDNLPVPDVLKIDVDGGEYDVLAGLRRTIESGGCQTIFCEIHPGALKDYNTTESDVLSLLQDWKYSITKMEISHNSRIDEYYIRADK
ncbi:FkbM family methyltransferase [Halobellus rubicundus]|uniref:FkbM family methyltransferase n=1 Tax=Halobellus rubicundus TaxID=2996466 RepID=A0ABD5MA52_9EURY